MNFKNVSTLIMNFGTPFPTSFSLFYDYELQTPFLNFNYTQQACSEHFCDGFIFHNLTDSAMLHSAHIINNNSNRMLGNFENDNDRNEQMRMVGRRREERTYQWTLLEFRVLWLSRDIRRIFYFFHDFSASCRISIPRRSFAHMSDC